MLNNGFIFDYAKCVGCSACIVACYNENKTNPPIAWRQINSLNKKKIPLSGFINLSIACNHCIDAPCIKSCPANAYRRDEVTGAVIHQSEKCIGCKYCTWACPFDAPRYNENKGTVEKCQLCNHLVSKGLSPACATLCPTGALSFGLIDLEERTDNFGIPMTNISPKLRLINSDVKENVPIVDATISGFECDKIVIEKKLEKIKAAEEWPLALFTLTFSFLVGWFSSFLTTPISQSHSFTFFSIGLVGILFSTMHLGKPFRAYRSIFNVKSSWLSREILFCGLFFSLSSIFLFFSCSIYIFIISLISGVILLLSIEKVYSVTKKKYRFVIHSSNTILTSAVFCFYFNGLTKLLVIVIVAKTLIYIFHKSMESRFRNYMFPFIIVRIVLGLVFPLGIVFFSNSANQGLLLLLLILGETIDRFEFYGDIGTYSPSLMLSNFIKNKIKEVNR